MNLIERDILEIKTYDKLMKAIESCKTYEQTQFLKNTIKQFKRNISNFNSCLPVILESYRLKKEDKISLSNQKTTTE
jgi:hypothetical protein